MPHFSCVDDALEALAAGRLVIVADSAERENEGDLVGAAEKVTAELVHFLISEGRGQLCLPVAPAIARRLNLRPMVPQSNLNMPCFTIPIDHVLCQTGISPAERAFTIQRAVNPESDADEFVRPGHVFPLVARERGVLERLGHTEATVDLLRMAGLIPAGVLCEICSSDGKNMAAGPELFEIARRFRLPIISIDEIVLARKRLEISAASLAGSAG